MGIFYSPTCKVKHKYCLVTKSEILSLWCVLDSSVMQGREVLWKKTPRFQMKKHIDFDRPGSGVWGVGGEMCCDVWRDLRCGDVWHLVLTALAALAPFSVF